MVRLVHLSDIHLTVPKLEWRQADWFNKRLAAWMNFRCWDGGCVSAMPTMFIERLMADISDRGIDHIIFSGDATALGFATEMQHAAQACR